MAKTRTLAISIGDVNGIGPEIALKAVHKRWPAGTRFVLIGNHALLAEQAAALGFAEPTRWAPDGKRCPHRLAIWDPGAPLKLVHRPGKITAAAGAAAARYIEAAVTGSVAGWFNGMCTAPISKEALQLGGVDYPGHTEMIADLTGTKRFAMMLMGGPLRVVIVTRHIPISAVPAALSTSDIVDTTALTAAALPWLGCKRARIGMCGLNPHAGEGGKIGDEEKRIIGPALRRLRRRGLNVAGPLPGDVAFHHAASGAYDAVVAMYHDQGLGPLKTLAFDSGVNITLGLPIIRTSPDHGTAFDIAGRGVANCTSMVAALRTALQLAGRRNPWAE